LPDTSQKQHQENSFSRLAWKAGAATLYRLVLNTAQRFAYPFAPALSRGWRKRCLILPCRHMWVNESRFKNEGWFWPPRVYLGRKCPCRNPWNCTSHRSAGIACPLFRLSQQTLPRAFSSLFVLFLIFEFTVVSSLSLSTELLPTSRATMMSGFFAAAGLGRVIGSLIGSHTNGGQARIA
jgi:hypothetical protein